MSTHHTPHTQQTTTTHISSVCLLPAADSMKPKQSSKSTKSTVEDFKRKRTKVGRKVKKNNVTTIKVQSKRINIPLQSNLDGSHSQKDVFARILRQFSHHSSQTRVAALEDLKSFLKSVAHPESYIALFFPSAMELLFDDERETRKALLVILSSVLGRFSSRCFASISSLIITYLCSGLTSLHKVSSIALLFIKMKILLREFVVIR